VDASELPELVSSFVDAIHKLPGNEGSPLVACPSLINPVPSTPRSISAPMARVVTPQRTNFAPASITPRAATPPNANAAPHVTALHVVTPRVAGGVNAPRAPKSVALPAASPVPLQPIHPSSEVTKTMEEKLFMVRRDDYKKMTREMMDVLFTQEELMTSSVTGRKGGTSANMKPALDINKTALIVSMVHTQFPAVEVTNIRQTMA
jgi:hypothetical protein